jgi:hypothetical protein
VVARNVADKPEVKLAFDVNFAEGGLTVAGRPVIAVLREFVSLARRIIGLFPAEPER